MSGAPATRYELLMEIDRLITAFLDARAPEPDGRAEPDDEAQVEVFSDSDGDDVDPLTGDIWDLEAQCVIGRKDPETKEKQWFVDRGE